jgi:hypothetical protein
MSIELLFWVIMLIWIILWGGIWFYPNNPYASRFHPIVLWVLLALLGWKVFGPMVHA